LTVIGLEQWQFDRQNPDTNDFHTFFEALLGILAHRVNTTYTVCKIYLYMYDAGAWMVYT